MKLLHYSWFILALGICSAAIAAEPTAAEVFSPPARPVELKMPATATAPIPAAYELTVKDAAMAVSEALQEREPGKRIQAVVVGVKNPVLYQSSTEVHAEIQGLSTTEDGKWSASLLIVGEKKVLSAIAISGKYEEVVPLPVLARQLRKEDVIRKEDITYYDMPQSRMRPDYIRDENALLGNSPRATVSANRPIRSNEITGVVVVKKGSLVQMVYATGALSITVTGQAMQDGAVGDVVEVRNVNSKTMLRGRVENAGTVTIGSNATASMAGEYYATAN